MTLGGLIVIIMVVGSLAVLFFGLISCTIRDEIEDDLRRVEWIKKKNFNHWQMYWLSWAATLLTFILIIGFFALLFFLFFLADSIVLW